MIRSLFILSLILAYSFPPILFGKIDPNQFEGSDTERIQAAVDQAAASSGIVTIPAINEKTQQSLWLIDKAILLPSHITVLIENCTLQLSNQCRDNMFRSNNIGEGITDPKWNHHISIIGLGEVTLKGAAIPRATGDGAKRLSVDPETERKEKGFWRVSYGSDAGKEDQKQTGDWRNILILMGYVKGFKLKNLHIEATHAWAVSHERVWDAEISHLRFSNALTSTIEGKEERILNRDGINLRHGCKNFRIDNISGVTGDDFIALSTLGLDSETPEGGRLTSTMVTSRTWHGPEDDTENIYITNIVCKSATRAIAIRANSKASIHHIFINGVIFEGGHNVMLVGGRGYGPPAEHGNIHNIHAMNLIGDGQSLIQIEEAITQCSFTNGTYFGEGEEIILYKTDETTKPEVCTQGLIKAR